jgi:hypothetical protein
MDEEVDVTAELYALKSIYEHNLDPLALTARTNLNTMIYYFEKFLESHRNYEETKCDLQKLNKKLTELGEIDE